MRLQSTPRMLRIYTDQQAIQLNPFTSLRELDLSHNFVTDICSIGLQALPLRALDLSHNRITNSFEQVCVLDYLDYVPAIVSLTPRRSTLRSTKDC
jgi:Leucine-rich repeat (LRR) protein